MEAQDNEWSKALLKWYDDNARILPWRQEATPYRVWISEIMLQQTQVATMLPYFERFMKTLPDVVHLAQASQEELYKLWEGLGYYSRARNLQRAAQMVIEEFNGELPTTYETLLKLPGVGEYTAGAIASIAFNERVPAVDGNVLRILARLLNDTHEINEAKNKKYFKSLAAQAVPKERPGDFNQALMDLGAMICTAKGVPYCPKCPIRSYCQAYKMGLTTKLPVKKRKTPHKVQQRTVLLLLYGTSVFVHKRPAKGLLANLWEYPNLEGRLTQEELAVFLQNHQLTLKSIEKLGEAKHIFSHIIWQMEGYLVWVKKPETTMNGRWVDYQLLKEEYAIPSAYLSYSKILEQIFARNSNQISIFDVLKKDKL